MDQKLSEYRSKRISKELMNNVKSKIGQIGDLFIQKQPEREPDNTNLEDDDIDDDDIEEDVNEEDASKSRSTIQYISIFVIWVFLYYFFITAEFGCVFFILSCVVGIYLNTRTGPKKRGEISAYSVFNKNCESIDGSIKIEQFEKELGYKR